MLVLNSQPTLFIFHDISHSQLCRTKNQEDEGHGGHGIHDGYYESFRYKYSYTLLKFQVVCAQLVATVHRRFDFDSPGGLTNVLQIKF